jgi:hypothetical protein
MCVTDCIVIVCIVVFILYISNLGKLSGLALTLLHLSDSSSLSSSFNLHDGAVDCLLFTDRDLLRVEKGLNKALFSGTELSNNGAKDSSLLSGYLSEGGTEEGVARSGGNGRSNLVQSHLQFENACIRLFLTLSSKDVVQAISFIRSRSLALLHHLRVLSGLLNGASIYSIVALAVLVSITLFTLGIVVIRPVFIVHHTTVVRIIVTSTDFFISRFSSSFLVKVFLSLDLLDDTLN